MPLGGERGRLQDKSVIITGAANGIGYATAKRFAAEGARLTLNDLHPEAVEALVRELVAAGATAQGVAGDVSKDADMRQLVAAAAAKFGRIDILVANAGIIPEANLADATAELWDKTMAVDGRGMFLSCKHAAAEMLKTGGGAIVCLSSVSGFVGQKGQARSAPPRWRAWRQRASRPASRSTRWAASAARRRSPTRSCFSPPMRPPS
jgi:NAD(P)-dependent dehydrogenase (short-subunit alcohol dehydrogenase family)